MSEVAPGSAFVFRRQIEHRRYANRLPEIPQNQNQRESLFACHQNPLSLYLNPYLLISLLKMKMKMKMKKEMDNRWTF